MKVEVSYSTEFGIEESTMDIDSLSDFCKRFDVVGIKEIPESKIYLALYNPMIEESGNVTISVHRTKEGAIKAAQDHKKEQKEIHDNYYKNVPADLSVEFGNWESWGFEEVELKD